MLSWRRTEGQAAAELVALLPLAALLLAGAWQLAIAGHAAWAAGSAARAAARAAAVGADARGCGAGRAAARARARPARARSRIGHRRGQAAHPARARAAGARAHDRDRPLPPAAMRRGRFRGERGQSSVELVALLPLTLADRPRGHGAPRRPIGRGRGGRGRPGGRDGADPGRRRRRRGPRGAAAARPPRRAVGVHGRRVTVTVRPRRGRRSSRGAHRDRLRGRRPGAVAVSAPSASSPPRS